MCLYVCISLCICVHAYIYIYVRAHRWLWELEDGTESPKPKSPAIVSHHCGFWELYSSFSGEQLESPTAELSL